MQGDKNTCPNFALCACVTGSKEKSKLSKHYKSIER